MRFRRGLSRFFPWLFLLFCLFSLTACAPSAPDVRILVDGQAWEGQLRAPETGPAVAVSLGDQLLLTLPFGEAHTVRLLQPGVGENTLVLTEDGVSMTEADCPGQDCIRMGTVTRENWAIRPLGGFIICLPHHLTVEVRNMLSEAQP